MNNSKKKTRTISLPVAGLTVFIVILTFNSMVYGISPKNNQIQNICVSDDSTLIKNDSVSFAKVIIYRPANALRGKCKLSTNINGHFKMKRREVLKLDAPSNTLNISVDAFSHKKERYTFNLTQNRVHYFRVQERPSSSGLAPFLEIIEVTEETFKRENL
jgi:hypothetical protein